jgi:hypothetical protein
VSDADLLVITSGVVDSYGRRKRAAVLARFRPYGALLLILFAASCFEYGGRPRTPVPLGRDVRITLTPEARTTLASRIGAQVRSVTGAVKSSDSSSVLLALSRTTLIDGTDASWNGDTVTIPAMDIALVEQRQIASGKTAVLIVVVAGVTAAVALSVGLSAATSSGTSSSGQAK